MGELRSDVPKRHIATVAVEDYFQAAALTGVVQPRQWSRFERRVERNTRSALALLDEVGVRATFFVLGWIAEELPELVREIAGRGHELASKGYHHRFIHEMSREEFREDLLRSREAIERAGRRKVLGYRIARGRFQLEDLWALEVLAEEGFAYDSSLYPRMRDLAGAEWRRFAHQHVLPGGKSIHELPLSSLRVMGFSVPIAGGALFRQLPHAMVRAALDNWERNTQAPFVLHFHVWEMDPDLPVITAAGSLAQMRVSRNVGQMPERLRDHFTRHSFGTAAGHLGLPQAELEPSTFPTPPRLMPLAVQSHRTPVSVVVPCYNEELVLPYLANTLGDVERALPAYQLRYIFVDDGSTDETLAQLQRLFGGRPDCQVIEQPYNQGVARAILAGVKASTTEMVCSIDCDCTYDPHQLQGMIPLFQDGIDLVTGSPYHPLGGVLNVPQWRLGLSKGLSFLYRRVLGVPLATFTSCFRVYRRSAFADLQLREGGFLGVAEMVGLLAMRRARIVEYPALLEVRMLGRSKMKIVRTIFGHFRLLARFGLLRLRRKFHSGPQEALPAAVGPKPGAPGA